MAKYTPRSLRKTTPTPDQADRSRFDALNGMHPPGPPIKTRVVPWNGKKGGGRGLGPHSYKRWNNRPTNV
jgi:hypothetical protein